MWIVVSLILLLVSAVVHWLHYNLTKPAPGPWGLPVVFSLPFAFYYQVYKNIPLQRMQLDHKRFGNVYQMRFPGLGGTDLIVVSSDPRDVEHVLASNFDNYPKPGWLEPHLRELFGGGIFSVNGHEWYVQRKKASAAFRVRDMKASREMFIRKTKDLLRVLREHEGQEVDFQTLLSS